MQLEYQNIKTFLQKAIFQIGLQKFWRLKMLKTLCYRHMLLVILKAKKLLELFTKHQTNQKEFRVEKVIKREHVKLYVQWKVYSSSFFNSRTDKEDSINERIFSRTKFHRKKCKS